jgi:hypothetical protein
LGLPSGSANDRATPAVRQAIAQPGLGPVVLAPAGAGAEAGQPPRGLIHRSRQDVLDLIFSDIVVNGPFEDVLDRAAIRRGR